MVGANPSARTLAIASARNIPFVQGHSHSSALAHGRTSSIIGPESILHGFRAGRSEPRIGTTLIHEAMGAASTGEASMAMPQNGGSTSPPVNEAGNVTADVTVGFGGQQPAYDQANGDIYDPDSSNNTVSVISDTTNTVVATVPVGANPSGVAYDSANGDLYVENCAPSVDGSVSVISGANNSLVTGTVNSVDLGICPDGAVYDSGNGYVYVSDMGSGAVSVISSANNSLVTNTWDSITTGNGPTQFAYDSQNGYVYVTIFPGSVDVISGLSVIATVYLGNNTYPYGIAYDSGNGDLYVADDLSNNVSVISGATNTFLENITLTPGYLGQPGGITYDGANGYLYVPNYNATNVSVVSGLTDSVVGGPITVATGPYPLPWGAVYDDRDGDVYVSVNRADIMAVISTLFDVGRLGPYLRGLPSLGNVTATVSVGNNSHFGTYDPDNGDIYVANHLDNNVSVISGSTNKVIGTIGLGANSGPQGVTYDSENGYLYVSDYGTGSNNVTVISGTTNKVVVSSIPVGTYPIQVAYDSGNGDVFVSNWGSNTVSVISNAGNNTVLVTIPVGLVPHGMAYDDGNGYVYVANDGSDNVSVISGATDMVVANIPVGIEPVGVAYDSGNGDIYVANFGSDNVTVISGTTNMGVANVAVGSGPKGVAYDCGNGFVYVANQNSNNVSVISGVTNTILGNITVGSGPIGVVYDSGNGNLYVSNSNAASVSVISTLELTSTYGVLGADLGQDLMLSAPLLGQGSGGDQVSVSVSPSSGLACVADPAGYGVIEGTCRAKAIGLYNVTFTVTDQASYSVWTSMNFTVFPGPTISNLIASPPTVDLGQSTVFTVSVAGGSGGNQYSWSGLPAGCASANKSSLTCAPNVAGITTPRVFVNDSFGTMVNRSISLTTYVDPTVATPTPSAASADVGQSFTFSTTASGGTGSYLGYAWTVSANLGCTLTSSASITCIPSAEGTTGAVAVTVTDSNGFTSPGATYSNFIVYAAPIATAPVANRTSTDVGQAVTFTSSSSGGSGGNTYNWSGLPAGCASANALVITCTTVSAGNFTVTVNVLDSNGISSNSSSLYFTVYLVPIAFMSASRLTLDIGQSLTLTTVAIQGSGGYFHSYNALPTGCESSDSATLTCVPTGSGDFSTTVTVTDSNGYSTTSSSLSITVSSDPVVSMGTSRSTFDIGQSLTLTTVTTLGSGGYSYSYSALPTGCEISDSAALTCVPTGSGNFSTTVTVTDSNGFAVTSNIVELNISLDPSIGALTASPTAADVGQSVTFSAALISAGSGGDVDSWSGLPSGCNSTRSLTVGPCIMRAPGTVNITLSVEDSNGFVVSSKSPLYFTVNQAPTIALTSNASIADVGQAVQLTASIFSAGPYTLEWYLNGSKWSLPPTDATGYSFAPTGAGIFSFTARITDSLGGTALTSSPTTVVVNPSLMPTISGPTSSTVIGGNDTFTLSVNGGTAPFTYQWLVNGTPVSGATGSQFTYVPLGYATYYVSVIVHDAAGARTTSAPWKLAVAPPSKSPGGGPFLLATLLWSIITAIIVIVILALLLLRRRRAGSAKPSVPKEEGSESAGETTPAKPTPEGSPAVSAETPTSVVSEPAPASGAATEAEPGITGKKETPAEGPAWEQPIDKKPIVIQPTKTHTLEVNEFDMILRSAGIDIPGQPPESTVPGKTDEKAASSKAEPAKPTCPRCGAQLPAAGAECPSCTTKNDT